MNPVVDVLKVLSVVAMFFVAPPSFGQKITDTKVTEVKPIVKPVDKATPTGQVSLANTIWDISKMKSKASEPTVLSYAAAKADPELMSKLFCYCGCDVSEDMPSLLTCFQSAHSTECHLCQEEALLASRLHKNGLSTREIQVRVDRKYSSTYPFETPSELLKRYEKSRLY